VADRRTRGSKLKLGPILNSPLLSSPKMPSTSMASSKDKKKDKTSKKAVEVSAGSGAGSASAARNEGTENDLAFTPLSGMTALDLSQVDEEFDWDAVKNDENKEIWLIRVPADVSLPSQTRLSIHPFDLPLRSSLSVEAQAPHRIRDPNPIYERIQLFFKITCI